MCKTGLHITERPDAWSADGASVYEVETDGPVEADVDGMKAVVRRCRLVREVSFADYAASRGVKVLRITPPAVA
jgi:hypothetical protein